MLAIGSERYMPFREDGQMQVPEEIITQANRIIGSGQTSLAKYCVIAASGDDPALDADDQPMFFRHVLERYDPERDLHFQTRTTIDTLDYSGTGWNAGSKLIWACRGAKRRALTTALPEWFQTPEGFGNPRFVAPGILALEGPAVPGADPNPDRLAAFPAGPPQNKALFARAAGQASQHMTELEAANLGAAAGAVLTAGIAMIVVCDDADFLSAGFSNFIWATFTRSNPSHDVYGLEPFVENKHWGCRGPVLIDARVKPWHAPGLVEDARVAARVDALETEGRI